MSHVPPCRGGEVATALTVFHAPVSVCFRVGIHSHAACEPLASDPRFMILPRGHLNTVGLDSGNASTVMHATLAIWT